jgi:predicted AAA+ superfamily ATPase
VEYRRRVLDDTLDELFPHIAALALEGAKGVGKTATATQRAKTTLTLSDPGQREALHANLERVVQVPAPVLIDEWQLEPAVWDRVRRAVDDDPTGGRFLLTGSAGAPQGARIHSGAGRIGRLHMRPLAISERGLTQPTVSLAALMSGEQPNVEGNSPVDLPTYVDEILRSGFPGIRTLPERARNFQLDSYIVRIIERELPENGVSVRRPSALRAWLAAYGAATATDASYTTILDAATAGHHDKPARGTVDNYREQLTRLFILEPLPAWIPVFNPIARLAHAPRHHLVDPALAARLVGVGKEGLIRGDRAHSSTGTWMGALFESLVTQTVRVYADALHATTAHLRTKDGAREIDLIIEGPDRRVVAIEVKLAPTVSNLDVRHLNWLDTKLGGQLADRLVITTGPVAYRRPDGVAVVPLALLGP